MIDHISVLTRRENPANNSNN